MASSDERLTLDIEKPAAGGRMLARSAGQVVLVAGAIPGERIAARVERREKGVLFAETVEVMTPSPDRRPTSGDPRCGGNVLAHIAYGRQVALKGEIIQDAFARIGRLRLDRPPVVMPSPERGYRMRARLHVGGARIGFFLEGTHNLCDAASTGQLSDDALAWIASAGEVVRRHALRGATAIDLAENMDGSERACHLELAAGVDPGPFGALGIGLVGLSAQRADRRDAVTLSGTPEVVDVLRVGPGASLRLRRHVRSFFQGNRFLVTALVDRVAALVAEGPVVDLYAGVGLFGLSLAAVGREAVTLVEGDPQSGVDLEQNARPFADRTTVARQSVESFVASRPARAMAEGTVVVDPPRTGLSREALAGLLGARPPRLVYVSCDMATLARDTRALIDAGYALRHLEGVDLFPNSAHVEAVAAYTIGA